jgi:hypothetical protein
MSNSNRCIAVPMRPHTAHTPSFVESCPQFQTSPTRKLDGQVSDASRPGRPRGWLPLESTTTARQANRRFPVQPHAQKYFASVVGQIISTSSPVSRSQEGRLAIVTDVGRGMRWTQRRARRTRQCGWRSRVVLTPRRWRQVARKCPRGDGDNKARSPGRSRRKPLKPSRREGRMFPAYLW